MFFNSWLDLLRILLVGSFAYLLLIFMLRVSGKRTLSKMNVFDFLVTVALGSTLASTLLSKDVALLEGLTAFSLLIFGQYLITYLSVRVPSFQKLVKAEPTLLFHQGRLLERTLHRERVTREEVLAAVRAKGFGSLDKVHAVVLETEGEFSVIGEVKGEASALANVRTKEAQAG